MVSSVEYMQKRQWIPPLSLKLYTQYFFIIGIWFNTVDTNRAQINTTADTIGTDTTELKDNVLKLKCNDNFEQYISLYEDSISKDTKKRMCFKFLNLLETKEEAVQDSRELLDDFIIYAYYKYEIQKYLCRVPDDAFYGSVDFRPVKHLLYEFVYQLDDNKPDDEHDDRKNQFAAVCAEYFNRFTFKFFHTVSPVTPKRRRLRVYSSVKYYTWFSPDCQQADRKKPEPSRFTDGSGSFIHGL